jgi:hypothetical protein
VLDQQDPAASPTRFRRAHHSGGTRSDDDDIEVHVGKYSRTIGATQGHGPRIICTSLRKRAV